MKIALQNQAIVLDSLAQELAGSIIKNNLSIIPLPGAILMIFTHICIQLVKGFFCILKIIRDTQLPI